MSKIVKGVAKVFKKVVKVVKKIAPYALAAAAIVFTGGAALGLSFAAGGFSAAVGGVVTSLGIGGAVGGVLTGAITGAGMGAAVGGILGGKKGLKQGFIMGGLTGGVMGAVSPASVGIVKDPASGLWTTKQGIANAAARATASGVGSVGTVNVPSSGLPGSGAPAGVTAPSPSAGMLAPGSPLSNSINGLGNTAAQGITPAPGGSGGGLFGTGGWMERNPMLASNLIGGVTKSLGGSEYDDQADARIQVDEAEAARYRLNYGAYAGRSDPFGTATANYGTPPVYAQPPKRWAFDSKTNSLVEVPVEA